MVSRASAARPPVRPVTAAEKAEPRLVHPPRKQQTRLVRDPALNALSRLPAGDQALVRSFILNLRGGWRPRISSERSITTYAHAVAHYAAHMRGQGVRGLTAVTRDHALGWVAAMRGERAPATVEVYLGAVRLFYDWLVEEGEMRAAAHPIQRVNAPRRPLRVNEPLAPEDITRILASQSSTTLMGLRNRALFAVLLDTGLRLAELAAMDVADLDWRHGHVKVTGKGSKERRVRVGSTALAAVDRYLRARARRQDVPWLWATRTGGRITPTGIYELHRAVGEGLGLHLHPHRWRHTNAQSLLDAGMDRESVRELLGHASLNTLKIYTRATDTERALAAHMQYSPMDRLRNGSHRGRR